MEVQTHDLDVLHRFCLFNDTQHVVHGNTELVLCQSGGDVCMGVSTHIGIQSEGHTGHLSFLGRQLIDDLQFGDALHVETEDIMIQTDIDLPITFTHTCIDNPTGWEAGSDAGLDLPATDTVGTHTCLTDNIEYLRVGISLDSIVYTEPLVFPSLLVDGTQGFAEQIRVVIVERRLHLPEFLDGEYSFALPRRLCSLIHKRFPLVLCCLCIFFRDGTTY